jgi:hypothetical protein
MNHAADIEASLEVVAIPAVRGGLAILCGKLKGAWLAHHLPGEGS